MSNYQVDPGGLAALCTDIFAATGMSREDAALVAESLVSADMRGIRSHGVVRVELYLSKIAGGAINPAAKPTVERETPVAATVDARGAAGAVASELAVKMARKKAAQGGVGIVTVRNSNHFGAAGYWSLKLAGEDMLGFAAANTHPLLAAPAGKTPVVGNNPFSVAVPAGSYPAICLDIANGVMALGKIHEYKRLNQPFPKDCWLDKEGNPTTDPRACDFLEFISLPFGMHKGFGLAVMVEAFTSLLAGGPVADELVPPGYNLDKWNPVSQVFVAVSLEQLLPVREYTGRVERFIGYLHSCPTRREGDRVYYPGELESISLQKALREGIVLPEEAKSCLCAAAAQAGVPLSPALFRPRP